jgi:hypothetical protein
VENNSLFIYQDSVPIDCEADMNFSIKKIGDTIKIYEINQNVPNPFSLNTTINVLIPKSVNNSIIYFYDAYGRQTYLKEIQERGLFKTNISYNFSSGILLFYPK